MWVIIGTKRNKLGPYSGRRNIKECNFTLTFSGCARISSILTSEPLASDVTSRSQHSPSSGTQAHQSAQLLKAWSRKCLGKGVRHVIVCWAVVESEGTVFDMVADKMISKINVLRA